MEPTSRWGITIPLPASPLAQQRDLIAALPGLGYTDAWSAELNGVDAFTPLVLASQWTDQLRLGTAIAGFYTRGPSLLAMSAATVADLAPGRFVLGIGTSSEVVVQQWNDLPFDRPSQRAKDTLRFLRAALAYWGDFPEEVDAFLDRARAEAAQARASWERQQELLGR